MYPWLWLWAPRIQFPYSGALSQTVEPNTNWFFGQIPPDAGDGALEQKIFDHATYGRQLGWITEVLLRSMGDEVVGAESAGDSLEKLKQNYLDVEALKAQHRKSPATADLVAQLERLRESDPKGLARLLAAFAPQA